ncbi:hypothetical protein WS62_29700 [Burkholderia sp. ABCPW 14]|uniref:type III secretion apparatus protein OrgA/MxiK n=1 Tax=Burkholderia sp. ABCPW 14 TaxID=1637860 RepID=UPI000770C641|nr:type III secretion apparatus protein OrgA/MxiK [Burkholderia sp. ABCPW 14]KVD78002.1 hypothetical protein WS62_29700 [Burkholderia sp. ABCPW 14]
MNPVTVLNIMYAPYAYAHPERSALPAIALDRCPASIANQLLIDHYGLETRIDFEPNIDSVARRCLDHWKRLPRICFLIGVRRLRAALIEQRRYFDLDPIAQRFMCVPLQADATAAPRSPRASDVDVLAAGIECIAAPLARLPSALRQRVPLLYPKAFDPLRQIRHAGGQIATDDASWNPSLFSLAVNYALVDHSTMP